MPQLFDRKSEVTWIKAGKKQIYEIARERAKQILKEHSSEPLPKDVQQKISDIVKRAEKELVKS